jgi:hypothetical protein
MPSLPNTFESIGFTSVVQHLMDGAPFSQHWRHKAAMRLLETTSSFGGKAIREEQQYCDEVETHMGFAPERHIGFT